jgi:hypothetical protein
MIIFRKAKMMPIPNHRKAFVRTIMPDIKADEQQLQLQQRLRRPETMMTIMMLLPAVAVLSFPNQVPRHENRTTPVVVVLFLPAVIDCSFDPPFRHPLPRLLQKDLDEMMPVALLPIKPGQCSMLLLLLFLLLLLLSNKTRHLRP